MTTKFWKAAALTALIGAAPVLTTSMPVEAGSFTVEITPKGKAAERLEKGLAVWSKLREKRRAWRNRARIDQAGSNNAAQVGQNGSGNAALIVQRGKGHSAKVSQSGDDNTLGIFQFGKNTSTTTFQGGGENSLILQGGW